MGNDKPEDKGLLPLPMVSSTKTGGATRTGGERIGPIGITTRTGGCVFEKEWQVFICFLNRFFFQLVHQETDYMTIFGDVTGYITYKKLYNRFFMLLWNPKPSLGCRI